VASCQAGPGNDINAGSPGSQKAPTWSPASLVSIRASASRAASRRPLRLRSFATAQAVARARWRRCFAFSLALRLLGSQSGHEVASVNPVTSRYSEHCRKYALESAPRG
jgi:hypothetical protein